MYLPDGPARPSRQALDEFWAQARAARPDVELREPYVVRWIGLDGPTTRQIFDLVRAGDKTGTFSLPAIFSRTGQRDPAAGDGIVLIDFDGTPTLVVRLEHVYEIAFGAMTGSDTAIDGSPVRDFAVWKPLHTQYWGALLQPFGLQVSPDMPVWVERFSLVHDRG